MSDLEDIRRDLLMQDNRMTSHPMFVVQQKRRIYGLGEEYTEQFATVDFEESERVGYKDIFEFVTCFFTNKAAEEYIETNAHNLIEPRVYVDSGWRNKQWQAVRALLMGDRECS